MTNQTTNRKSFLIHKDSLDILDKLSDEQAGRLFKAIKFYQKNNKIPKLDFTLDLVFTPFLNQFLRDEENYKKTCEARKIAGSLGGKQKVANASNCKQKVANVADNKNKNKKDNENESDSDSKNDNKKDISKEIIINALPIFIDQKLFADFAEMRKKIKKPITERAYELLIGQLKVFESNNAGAANVALQNSIMNCWQGVFEPKILKSQSPPSFPTKQQQLAEQDKQIYSNLLKKHGKASTTNF